MKNRIVGRLAAAAVVVSVVSFAVEAQINLMADVINVRTSTQKTATTQHFGRLNINGTSPTGSPYVWPTNAIGYGGLTVTENTTSGVAIAGINPSLNSGAGGYFSGGTYGIFVTSNAVSAGAWHCAGRFYAGGGSTNYGIRASAPVQANSYAGYFEGTLMCTQNPIVYSDDKLKNNEEDISGSLEKILLLKPKTYEYDTTGRWKKVFAPKRHFGFVAQQLEEIFPEMVTNVTPPPDSAEEIALSQDRFRKQETFKAVDYVALIPVLVNAIQEQQKEIDELKRRLGYR